jgi:hypothetical protein
MIAVGASERISKRSEVISETGQSRRPSCEFGNSLGVVLAREVIHRLRTDE